MRLGKILMNSYAVEMLCDPTQSDILWEFETLGEGNEGRDTFVVFRFLSENRCEVVRGRDTRVMLLWLASEVDNGVPEAERKVWSTSCHCRHTLSLAYYLCLLTGLRG